MTLTDVPSDWTTTRLLRNNVVDRQRRNRRGISRTRMTNLFTDDVRRNPFALYSQLRNNSPVLHDSQSGLWMIFDYDGVKRALSDHDAFSSRNGPDWLIFTDPPRHTKLRGLIS